MVCYGSLSPDLQQTRVFTYDSLCSLQVSGDMEALSLSEAGTAKIV